MNKARVLNILVALFAALLISLPVQAAESGDVIVELAARKVIKGADNKEKLESAEKANPGDVIEYTVVYKNKGKGTVRNLLGSLPVPLGMEFMAGTASPDSAMASLDGRTFLAIPLKRQVRLANGRTEARPVPVNEYRFLRWDLKGLAADQSVTVSARMKIISVSEPLKAKDIIIRKDRLEKSRQ